ncbi:unnamed protein product [Parnassius mnemosyne]|uniref:Peptidase S1 domain-containing protein n=1 Tax=Parnassius mnemosyne TaxID=213953 RepID=A0AAV1LIY6_9NEOP
MKVCVVITLVCLTTIIKDGATAGFLTTIDKYPFATALLCSFGSSNYNKACGGTILTNSAILSAASCFYNDDNTEHPANWWRARLGSSDSNSGGTIYLIRRIDRHPDFNLTTRINDIAVLRTSINLILVPGLVETAYVAGGAYPLTNSQAVWGLGWGESSQALSSGRLREMQLWIADQQFCANRYSDLGFAVTNNMLCTGPPYEAIRGQCQGDHGSPLVHNGVVVGVFMRMEECELGYPNINTRVPSYARWIEATVVSN